MERVPLASSVRPRKAGKKQPPSGYKLFEQKDLEWIGKEYIDQVRTSTTTANAYLSLNVGSRGYLDDDWRVHLIIDDSEALLIRGWEDQPAIKISGYDFSKTADGEALDGDSFFQVTDTDSYKSVEGQDVTVLVVKPLLLSSPPPKPVSASGASLPYQRSWTNANNGNSITATYYGYESGTVNLVNSKNEVIGIPLEKLSTEDKSHVAKLIRIRRDVVEYNKWAGWRNPTSLLQKLRDP